MQGSKRVLVAAVVAAVGQMSLGTASADAANIVWDGGGSDSSVLTPANWVGDVLPTTADAAQFAGTTQIDPFVPATNVQYGSLFFLASATNPFTVSGPGTITLGTAAAGNFLNNDTVGVVHTINANVNMNGGSINATVGGLNFGGTINIGNNANAVAGNNVTINTAANTVNVNNIAGTGTATSLGGALTKVGTGLLNVTGNNAAWQGNVFINGGALRINNADALGTGGGRIETALTSGGTGLGALELTGGFTLNKNVVTRARQAATIAEVSIRNVAGNNTINQVQTGSGGSQFNYESAADLLTINTWDSSPTTGTRQLRLLGAGNGQINNWTAATSNTVALIKDGAGTWTLGANLNSAVGVFTTANVNNGTLLLDGNLGGKVTGNTFIGNGGTLRLNTTDGITGEVGNSATATTVNIQQGGTLDATQFTTYSLQANQTIIGGGTFKVGGTLSTFGDNAIYIGNGNANQVGTFNVQGSLSISNAFATAAGGMRFDLNNTTTVGGGVNDLISVTGDLLVDNSGGAIPLYINPIGGALANGTYRLIEFGSGATRSASDFVIVGASAGTTRQSLNVGTAAGQVNLVVSGSAASLVWNGNANNNWEVSPVQNWLNGASPDRYYQFDNVTFTNAAANKTVSLVGDLTPGSITVNSTSDYLFTGAGHISGATGLTKDGSGKLTIANTANNTFTGAININSGTLEVGNGGTDGSLPATPIANNGTFVANKSVAVDPGLISGTGNVIARGTGALVLNDVNTYTGTTTVEALSAIQLGNAGGLGDAASGTTVAAGGQLYNLGAFTVAEPLTLAGDGPAAGLGAYRAGSNATATYTGTVTLTGNTTFNADGGAGTVFSGALTGANSTITTEGPGTFRFTGPAAIGSGSLVKNGTGLTTYEGTLAYTGNTTVNAGTLQIPVAPSGTVTLADAAALIFAPPAATTLNINSAITSAGRLGVGPTGGTVTLTGNLSGFTGTLSAQQSLLVPTVSGSPISGTLVVATPTNAARVLIDDVGQGNGQGVVRLANSNAIAPTAVIDVFPQQLFGTGRVELSNNINVTAATINLSQRHIDGFPGVDGLNPTNAAQLTPAILNVDGANTLNGNIVVGGGGSFAAVSTAAGSTLTLNGTIKPLATALSGRNFVLGGAGNGIVNSAISDDVRTISVLKTGAGTWTLNGATAYTGRTAVIGGNLVIGTGARNSVLPAVDPGIATQFVDIKGGRLILNTIDAADRSAVASQVNATLAAGYAQATKFSTGQIRSVGIEANRTLGVYSDAANNRVIVGYTLFGDADVDLSVGFNDLLALAQNYNGTGKIWGEGDFNYDAAVNFDDLLLLAANYNTSVTPAQAETLGSAFLADFALAQSVVPEPATLGALGLGAVTLLGRRRKALNA